MELNEILIDGVKNLPQITLMSNVIISSINESWFDLSIKEKLELQSKLPWLLQIDIELDFDPNNLNELRNELLIQENLEAMIEKQIRAHSDMFKLVSFVRKKCITYNWYLEKPIATLSEDDVSIIHHVNDFRPISFTLIIDEDWSILNKLKDRSIYGF